MRLDRQVRAVHDRVQVGDGRAGPPPVALGDLVPAVAVLLAVVEVLVQRQPQPLHRLQERLAHRAAGPGLAHRQRTAGTVELRSPALVVLGPDEVREQVVPAPARAAGVAPLVVVERVAAHVDHRVQRRRAAEHPPARQVDPPPVGARLPARDVVPVVLRAEQRAERRRDVDEVRGVRRPRLHEQDLHVGILGQPVGEHAAGRPGAHDHVVVHRAPPLRRGRSHLAILRAMSVATPGRTAARALRRPAVLVPLAVTLLFAAWMHAAPADQLARTLPTEDAYYALAVAKNVALGEGISADGRIDTNGFQPLWVAVNVPLYAIAGGDRTAGLRLSQLLSTLLWLAFVALLALLARDLARRHGGDGALAAAAAAIVAAGSVSIFRLFHNGLETGITLVLLAAAVLLLDRMGALDGAPRRCRRRCCSARSRSRASTRSCSWPRSAPSPRCAPPRAARPEGRGRAARRLRHRRDRAVPVDRLEPLARRLADAQQRQGRGRPASTSPTTSTRRCGRPARGRCRPCCARACTSPPSRCPRCSPCSRSRS